MFNDVVIFVYRSRELIALNIDFKESIILNKILTSKIIMMQKCKKLFIFFQKRAIFWITGVS